MDKVEILLVEDNPADVDLVMEAFDQCGYDGRLRTVQDGVEAMDYMRKQGRYHDAVRPALILLDLNMPRKDGRQVLKELKEDPLFQSIPVIVLSTSKADEDIVQAYALHANCFVHKPRRVNELMDLVSTMVHFWFAHASLPSM